MVSEKGQKATSNFAISLEGVKSRLISVCIFRKRLKRPAPLSSTLPLPDQCGLENKSQEHAFQH